jgi:autotransporter translocation and assembly factor TamB
LRLRLTERLDVESRSGVEQSVDLFYRIEYD